MVIKTIMVLKEDVWPIDKYFPGLSTDEINFFNNYIDRSVMLSDFNATVLMFVMILGFKKIY